jgi:hypothetical protein
MPKPDNSIYGLLKQGYTLAHVSAEKGVTRERVRQVAKAMVESKIIDPPSDYKPQSNG